MIASASLDIQFLSILVCHCYLLMIASASLGIQFFINTGLSLLSIDDSICKFRYLIFINTGLWLLSTEESKLQIIISCYLLKITSCNLIWPTILLSTEDSNCKFRHPSCYQHMSVLNILLSSLQEYSTNCRSVHNTFINICNHLSSHPVHLKHPVYKHTSFFTYHSHTQAWLTSQCNAYTWNETDSSNKYQINHLKSLSLLQLTHLTFSRLKMWLCDKI